MNDQLNLHFRSTDPATSRQGPHQLNASCARVLAAIRNDFGADKTFTDGELARRLGEERGIVARRRKDLMDRGHVEPVGMWTDNGWEPTTRMGRRGRHEEVWKLTVSGFQADVA
jgi:hypothetical protein